MKIWMRILLPTATAIVLTVAAGVALVRGGEATAGALQIEAWARATPPGADVGAAYLTITNAGDRDDRLLSVSSDVAKTIELHETLEENGVAKMRPLEDLLVPAGGVVEMRPGGAHLMLMGLAAPLKEGAMVPLSLTFEHAGVVSVDAYVAPIGAEAPHGHAGS